MPKRCDSQCLVQTSQETRDSKERKNAKETRIIHSRDYLDQIIPFLLKFLITLGPKVIKIPEENCVGGSHGLITSKEDNGGLQTLLRKRLIFSENYVFCARNMGRNSKISQFSVIKSEING